MADNTLSFEPTVSQSPQLNFEPTLSFEPDISSSSVPMNTPTAEEVMAAPKGDTSSQYTPEQYQQMGDWGVFVPDDNGGYTTQIDINNKYAKAYKYFQSGNVIQDANGNPVDRGTDNLDRVVPSTDMYEGNQNPEHYYEYLKSKSTDQTLTGEPILNGRIIPKPGQYDWLPNSTNMGNPITGPFPKVQQDISDAAREGAKNALVTGAAIIDQTFGTDLAKKTDSWIASPPEAKGMDSVIKDAAKITSASVLGAKAGLKAGQIISDNKTLGQAVAGLASMVSGVAVLNPDDPTLVTGKNALAPLITGAENKDGSFSGEIIAKKLNQLQDAFMTAYPGVQVAHAASWVGNIVNNLAIRPAWEGISSNAVRLKVGQELFSHLGKYGELNEKDMSQLVADLKANRNGVVDLGNAGEATVERTPMSAIHEGATKRGDYVTANRAMELESAGIKTGIPELTTAKEQPTREMNNALQNAVDSAGGTQNINKTGGLLADQAIDMTNQAQQGLIRSEKQGRKMVQNAQDQATQDIQNATTEGNTKMADIVSSNQNALNDVKNSVNTNNIAAQEDLDKVNRSLDTLYNSDKEFASTVNQLSKDSGIDVADKFKARTVKEIMPKLAQAAMSMKQHKNDLYSAIPEGASVDLQSFTDAVAPVVKQGWLPSKVSDAISAKLADSEDLDNIDFKFLFNEVNPAISDALKTEIDRGPQANPLKIEALTALRKNIYEDQMSHLMDSGDKATAKAARDAVNYYKYTYSKYTDPKTPIGQLFGAIDQSYYEHNSIMSAATEAEPKKILDLNNNYRVSTVAQNVPEAISNKDFGSSKQVMDFMSEPQYEGGKDDLMRMYKGEIAGAIADHFQNGGTLENLNPNIIYKSLRDKGVVIKDNFSEATAGIEKFLNDMKEGNLAKKTAEENLKKTQELGKTSISAQEEENKNLEDMVAGENKQNLANVKAKTEQDISQAKTDSADLLKAGKRNVQQTNRMIKKSGLAKFVEEGPDGLMAKQNPYDSIKVMLRRNNNENKFADIAKRIKSAKDPEAQKGLEAAYFSYLQDSMSSPSNEKRVSIANTKKLESDRDSLMKYGNIIFGNYDDPKEKEASLATMAAMHKLVGLVANEQKKSSSSSINLMDKINSQKEAISASGYISRLFFGALSRQGTMVSTTAARIIKRAGPDSVAKEVLSKALTDHDYFIKLAEDVRSQFLKGTVPPDIKNAVLSGIVQTGRQESLDEGGHLMGRDKKQIKVPPGVNLKDQ